MSFYVYILKSTIDESFYKGFTEDPIKRLIQHNNGETKSTRHFRPWTMVYLEELENKSSALKREKNLKKAERSRLEALIDSPKNIVAQFF